MPKRQKKKYRRPRKLYDLAIIKKENALIKKYGLKNRREVWRADFAVSRIRDIAKKLITAEDEDKKEFISRQKEKGFKVDTIAEVLGLDQEDYLKRRLQSIIVEKGFAKTYKQARQFITHKHIKVNGKIIDAPSHITTIKEERDVEIDLSAPQKKELSDEEERFLRNIKKKEEKENPKEANE